MANDDDCRRYSRRGYWCLVMMLACVLLPGVASASPTTYFETWDDFEDEFTEVSSHGASAKWFYFSANTFVGNDGVPFITSGGALKVVPPGTSTQGTPAFTLSVGQEQTSGLPGGFDHVKWLVYGNSFASSGYPGFDAHPRRELACQAIMSGKVYGTGGHPFAAAVYDSASDLRLANFALTTIDFETYMVFDFFITNSVIYAFYERLPFGRGPDLGEDYASFSYAVPVAPYHPHLPVFLKIGYDRDFGVVRWIVNGVPVYEVSDLGARLASRDYLVLDHGGVDTPVEPRQLNCGMGSFTLLDARLGGDLGLVRLSSANDFYFDPDVGQPSPMSFVDEQSLEASRLFGQGAEFTVWHYWVSSLPRWGHW